MVDDENDPIRFFFFLRPAPICGFILGNSDPSKAVLGLFGIGLTLAIDSADNDRFLMSRMPV